MARVRGGDENRVIAGYGPYNLLPGLGIQRHGHGVRVARPGLQNDQVCGLPDIGQEFLEHHRQSRLGGAVGSAGSGCR